MECSYVKDMDMAAPSNDLQLGLRRHGLQVFLHLLQQIAQEGGVAKLLSSWEDMSLFVFCMHLFIYSFVCVYIYIHIDIK